MVNKLDDASVTRLYRDLFLHKMDNRDFFDWNTAEHIAVNGMGYSHYGGWSEKSVIRLNVSEGGGMRWDTFQPVPGSDSLAGVFPTGSPVRLDAARPCPGSRSSNGPATSPARPPPSRLTLPKTWKSAWFFRRRTNPSR